jgi:hypothetical protein
VGGGAHISGLNEDLLSAVQMFKKLHFFSENTLAGSYFFGDILRNLCRAIQKVLAGQKWPAGPGLAAPGLGRYFNHLFTAIKKKNKNFFLLFLNN